MSPISSSLHDETTFYHAFLKDLAQCKHEVIIESPFITSERMSTLWLTFRALYNRGVKIVIITRDPREHTEGYTEQSETEIQALEALGIQVFLCTGNHHRKLAILDRRILWEGSLNILSQLHSREIMRRLDGGGFAGDMYQFLHLGRYI